MIAPNTLGLDDDLDGVELLIAIHRAFDVEISNEDAGTINTMGDLHDLLMSKFEDTGGEKCHTSMAFYRVRRALKAVLGKRRHSSGHGSERALEQAAETAIRASTTSLRSTAGLSLIH